MKVGAKTTVLKIKAKVAIKPEVGGGAKVAVKPNVGVKIDGGLKISGATNAKTGGKLKICGGLKVGGATKVTVKAAPKPAGTCPMATNLGFDVVSAYNRTDRSICKSLKQTCCKK